MAFITMNQYATEPTVLAAGEYVDILFSKDHRVGLTPDEAVTLANDLLEAAEAAKSQQVAA